MADILGRRAERDECERLLARARAGHSGVVVACGPAGIGKTALLDHVRHSAMASGFRTEGAVGVESEAHFAYAGLYQLCAPLLDRVGALPDPQQAALGVAFGLREGAAPDGFLVGLATLNLLSEVAEDAPLLCLIDDAHWLDQASAQALAFVARRIAAEQMAMVFGLREPGAPAGHPFADLPELRLEGLSEADARALLADAVHAPLDDRVVERIIAEAHGNPLALLELPLSADPAKLAGGFELPDMQSVPRLVEESFHRRSSSLPPDTQMLLLTAAAEPTGDAGLLWRAAEHLGIAPEAAEPAERAGLLEVGSRVSFHHPLVRSAVYHAAPPPDRRRVHSALAAATDSEADPDRRAWHRAQAVQGTDEDAAADLEQSADRARRRGGLAAAAAFLHHAVELTPSGEARAARALEAAHAKHDAGASEAARELLQIAAAGPLEPLQAARLELLRAQIEFHLARGREVPEMLLAAARTFAPLDATASRETYLHALDAAIITGGLGHGDGVREAAEAARDAPPPPGPPGPADLLLDGLVASYAEDYASGVPGLRRALEAFCSDEPARAEGASDDRQWLWLASRVALRAFDDELLYELAQRNVRVARETGALSTLSVALPFLSVVSVLVGESARAVDLVAEEAAIRQVTGGVTLRFGHLMVAAWRGQQADALESHGAAIREASERGNSAEVALAHHALAVLHNGLGNYEEALDAAERASESLEPMHISLALPELVEASCRAEQVPRARAAVEQLELRARASGTEWALGLAARTLALVTDGPAAEEHYLQAIDHLRGCRMAIYLARTHLVYGEWLRRERRRQDAREQLRRAHEMLSEMGVDAYAERAARELRATGEHPRKRTAQPSDDLTAHELHIARLVATGATNREVGAQLFLSPRTIEAHLRSIFRKLGVSSRRQLRDLQLS